MDGEYIDIKLKTIIYVQSLNSSYSQITRYDNLHPFEAHNSQVYLAIVNKRYILITPLAKILYLNP